MTKKQLEDKYRKDRDRIIIFGVGIIFLILFVSLPIFEGKSLYQRWNGVSEQSYCSNHKGDCECVSIQNQIEVDGKFKEVLQDDFNYLCRNIGEDDYMCEQPCSEYKKKNECQLKLEKLKDEGENKLIGNALEKVAKDYAENCICEENERLFLINYGCENEKRGVLSRSCDIEDVKEADKKRFREPFKYFYCKEFECKILKDYSSEVRCIKAREATPCEKGNQDYILKKGFVSKPTYEVGDEIVKEICVKKSIEDLSCSEFQQRIEKNINSGWRKNNEENDKLLLLMIEKGCGLTPK